MGKVGCRKSILFDTDAGIDDIFALLFFLSSSTTELCGISTVFGNFPVEKATVNILNTLRLLRCCADMRVYQGASHPEEAFYKKRADFHGCSSVADYVFTDAVSVDDVAVHVADIDSINTDKADTVFAAGPLTNINRILSDNIKELFISGGILKHKHAGCFCDDYNIKADITAAVDVFRQAKGIVLMPVSITESFVIDEADAKKLHLGDSLIGDFIKSLLSFVLDSAENRFGKRVCLLHDTLSAIVLSNSSIADFEKEKLAVIDEGDSAGILDYSDSGAEVLCCKNVDIIGAKKLFLDSLNELIYDTRKCY